MREKRGQKMDKLQLINKYEKELHAAKQELGKHVVTSLVQGNINCTMLVALRQDIAIFEMIINDLKNMKGVRHENSCNL